MFDKCLQPGAINTANWEVTRLGVPHLILTALAADKQVLMTGFPSGGPIPPDGTTYSPPPFDLIGVNEQPVAAFLDLPFV